MPATCAGGTVVIGVALPPDGTVRLEPEPVDVRGPSLAPVRPLNAPPPTVLPKTVPVTTSVGVDVTVIVPLTEKLTFGRLACKRVSFWPPPAAPIVWPLMPHPAVVIL